MTEERAEIGAEQVQNAECKVTEGSRGGREGRGGGRGETKAETGAEQVQNAECKVQNEKLRRGNVESRKVRRWESGKVGKWEPESRASGT